MKCKRRNWQGFSRFVTNFLSVQSTLIEKIDLIFDAKMESGVRYMAIVTCDLIKYEFNF
jgi:hypothetical protein